MQAVAVRPMIHFLLDAPEQKLDPYTLVMYSCQRHVDCGKNKTREFDGVWELEVFQGRDATPDSVERFLAGSRQ